MPWHSMAKRRAASSFGMAAWAPDLWKVFCAGLTGSGACDKNDHMNFIYSSASARPQQTRKPFTFNSGVCEKNDHPVHERRCTVWKRQAPPPPPRCNAGGGNDKSTSRWLSIAMWGEGVTRFNDASYPGMSYTRWSFLSHAPDPCSQVGWMLQICILSSLIIWKMVVFIAHTGVKYKLLAGLLGLRTQLLCRRT